MKRFMVIAGLVVAASTSAQAQYYGSNGSIWNNPMSASADIIIQQNMERQRLKESFRSKRATKSKTSRSVRSQQKKRYSSKAQRRIR